MIEFGNWQIRRADPLNLTLYRRRKKQGRGKYANSEDNGTVGWFPTNNYFQSVEHAVLFALRNEMMDAAGTDSELLSIGEFENRVIGIVADFKEWLSGEFERA